ncbi:MAG: histidine kinase [Prolixibacteraceae bacterium]|nr:histidine kinase [Prolixibacteraceae bacterium]
MASIFEKKIDTVIRNRLLQHIMFWALSFLVLINILKVSASPQLIDAIYTLIFMVCIVPTVYANLLFLIPVFMAKRRFLIYGLLLALAIMAGIGFYFLMFNVLIDYILPGYYFIAYYDFFDILLYLSVFLLLTTLLKLARAWFKLQKIENETTRIQLNALTSQVNPHFLFNTLSSIYALARKKSDETPDVIMKLSEVLRYMLYETDVEKIAIEKEMGIIHNIIEIHKVRLGNLIDIELTINGETSDVYIAPLILIPFVENSFKHGKPNSEEKFYVKIELKTDTKHIRFSTRNSINNQEAEKTGKNKKGIGLENVSKRLKLLYPGKHTLNIEKGPNEFRVELCLKRKKS